MTKKPITCTSHIDLPNDDNLIPTGRCLVKSTESSCCIRSEKRYKLDTVDSRTPERGHFRNVLETSPVSLVTVYRNCTDKPHDHTSQLPRTKRPLRLLFHRNFSSRNKRTFFKVFSSIEINIRVFLFNLIDQIKKRGRDFSLVCSPSNSNSDEKKSIVLHLYDH